MFEILIIGRPVSSQSRNKGNKAAWKNTVRQEVSQKWTREPYSEELHFTLVYLYDGDPAVDMDNIIKPIQDALNGLIYDDDKQIIDVQAHRRSLNGIFDVERLPPLLLEAIYNGYESVYLRIKVSKSLETYL